MKKIFIVSFLLMLSSSFAFADAFAPTKLTIAGPADDVLYEFDGSTLDIPVTITGAPALVRFMVFTKDKASEIIDHTSGWMGWHYVNKIDTCMYMSGEYQFVAGSQTITWDGKDDDGGTVPAGDCTYYLWGYDNVSARTKVLDVFEIWGQAYIIDTDESDQPLANPYIFYLDKKWRIGDDPLDANLLETCKIDYHGFKHSSYGKNFIRPDDWSTVYTPLWNADAVEGVMFKYEWIPNGEAVWDPEFDVKFSCTTSYGVSPEEDDQYIYAGELTYKEPFVRTYCHVIDYVNEEYVGFLDYSEVMGSPEDGAKGDLYNGGLSQTYMHAGLFTGRMHQGCKTLAFEPRRFAEGEEDADEAIRWINGNGDPINWLDQQWEPDQTRPWECNVLGASMSTHGFYGDWNNFIQASLYHGSVSLGVCSPDGSPLGYYSFAGEVDEPKHGMLVSDNGSAFDGYYSILTGEAKGGTWWIGGDSFKGVIKYGGVGVESGPVEISTVSPAYPNPANPATTIGYTLAKAGDVTIDIFNVAGQKIDTIVNEFKNAGSHSVVWDGSEFSTGVYFYTVKSGDFSKTMKVTLLK